MAGRSVGSIEVTVDADTGRLKAQLTKAGGEGGAAYKKAAEREMRDLEAEVSDVDVKKGATAKAGKQIEESLDDLLASVGVRVDDGDISAVGAHIEESLDDLLGSVGIDNAYIAETTRVEREMEQMLSSIDAQVGDLKDQKAFLAAQKLEREIEEILDDIKGKVNVSPDMTTVARTEAILDESFDDIEAEVDVGYNKASKAATDAALRRNFSSVGKQSGADFGDGFGGGLSTRMKFIIGGIVALMEPAAVALQGLTSMASSVLSSAFSGLAGGVGALAPVLAGAAASAVTLTVGFQGMGDALGSVSEEFAASLAEGRAFNSNSKEIRAAMATLAPAAREVVEAFAGLQPQFTAIRQVVQQNLFSGLGQALSSLGRDVIPQIGVGLAGLARTFNSFFKGLAADARGIDFAQLFADIGPVVDRVLDAFRALFRTIQPFLHAAAPAAQMLADSFKAGAESIEDMVNAGAKSGNLTKFFVEGVESLREWGRLLQAAGDALFTFFEAGKGQGDSFVKSLTGAINEWDSWMESVKGQKALEQFFATGRAFAEDLKPVLTGLKGFFENIISPGAEKRFEEFGEAIGRVLPSLGSLFEIFGRTRILTTAAELLAAFAGVVDSILPDLQELADIIGGTLRGAVQDLSPVFDALGGALAGLAGPVGQVFVALGGVIEDLAVPIGVVIDALGEAAAQIATAIGPRVTELGEALGEVLGRLPGLISFAADAITFLIDAGTALLGVFNDLPGPIQSVVLALAGLFLLRDKIAGFGAGFLTLRDNIILLKPAFQDVGSSFRTMFDGLKKMDFSQVTAGMKNLGPALLQAGKSAGAAAGVAIAGALGIAFGAQMVAQSGDMQGKVMGVMSIIGSAVGAFAAGGPIVGGVTLGLGAIGAAFASSAQHAKDAAADVTGYAEALEEVAASGDATAIVTRVMDRLADQADVVADTFDDLGFSVGEWARGMADGTQDASDGMEDFVTSVGGAGIEVAEMLDKGIVSAEQLADTFKGVADAGALPEGPIRDLGLALEDMGLNSRDVGKIFDFLYDTGARLGQGQEELDQKVRLTGEGLAGLGPDGQEGAAGLDAAAQALGYTDKAALDAALGLGKVDQAAIDAKTGLADFGDEAGNAATDTEDFKIATEELKYALGNIDITKVFSDAGAAAARFEGLRREMEETADAAGQMKSAFDLLVGTQLTVQEATSNFEQDIDDLGTVLEDMAKDGEEAVSFGGQLAATFDLTSEAGRNVAAAIRDGVGDIGAWGEAQLAAGKSQEEVTAGMQGMREGLIDAASQFFATREEAAAFVDQLGLTPDSIALSVQVAGMQKALDDLTEFDRDLDGIPDTKDMTFNAPTIETIRAKAAELGVDISAIPDDVVVEFFANKLRESLEDVEILGGNIDDLDGMHPEATVTVRNEQALADTRAAATALGNIEGAHTATLAVDDQAQPVLDPLTSTLETYAGNTYAADITAVDEQARDAFNTAFTAGSTWNETKFNATIAATDEVQPVLDPATATLEVYAGNTYEADLAIADAATPVVTPVIGGLETYDARIYESEITLLDHTTPVMDPVKGALDVYDQRIYSADIIANAVQATEATGTAQGAVDRFGQTTAEADVAVAGADTAKAGADEVVTAVEGVGNTSGEANVSIIGNTIVMIQLGIIGQALEILHAVRAKPQISLPDYARVVSQITTIATMLFSLNNQRATPTITIPTWFTAISQVGSLTQAIRNIPDKTANVRAAVSGLSDVQALDRAINNLSSKTVTVTTRNVTIGQPANMTGAIVPGSAAGELIRGPTLRRVGERGYDEAIIPLQLPLNRVDPSVRDLAALLRGELVPAKAGPTKIINQYMTVNTVVQDPVAVATQVVNRSAMLAHN